MNLLRTVWRLYRRQSPAVRAHVMIRALTCPVGSLLSYFPNQGKVLDVGCGHGLLIHLLSADPGRRNLVLHGIDHDSAKIRMAQGMARPGVHFSDAALGALAETSYDAVAIVDVLYTVNQRIWPAILSGCLRVLRPGGRLIVKEVIDRPRWKYRAILAQELLSVKVLGITKGARPHFESADTYRRAVERAGFRMVAQRPLASKTWVSHYLFVASKP